MPRRGPKLKRLIDAINLSIVERALRPCYKKWEKGDGKVGRPPHNPIGLVRALMMELVRGWSRDDLVDFLAKHPEWRRWLGLKKTPDHTIWSHLLKRVPPTTLDPLLADLVRDLKQKGFLFLTTIKYTRSYAIPKKRGAVLAPVMPMIARSRRLLLLPVVLALAAPAVLPTGASNHPVNWLQPGDIATIGGTQCTLDFVFDGSGSLAGKVYLGIAGHCVNVGQPVNSNGYTNFGTVVMEDAIRDFALIEVKTTVVAHVKGEVKGHPGTPTGFTTSGETNQGDILQFSGFGLGFGLTQPTQENRVGILVSDNNTFYCGEGPVIFGDSGGPVVHMATGKALGIVNEISPPCSVLGFTIEGIISHAATLGFPITLRTA